MVSVLGEKIDRWGMQMCELTVTTQWGKVLRWGNRESTESTYTGQLIWVSGLGGVSQ